MYSIIQRACSVFMLTFQHSHLESTIDQTLTLKSETSQDSTLLHILSTWHFDSLLPACHLVTDVCASGP